MHSKLEYILCCVLCVPPSCCVKIHSSASKASKASGSLLALECVRSLLTADAVAAEAVKLILKCRRTHFCVWLLMLLLSTTATSSSSTSAHQRRRRRRCCCCGSCYSCCCGDGASPSLPQFLLRF